MARTRIELPEVTPFDEFKDSLRRGSERWQQGEHFTLIGPTGAGKTTAGLHLATLRRYLVVFALKPKDKTLDGLARRGWTVIREWPPPRQAVTDSARIILWPRFQTIGDRSKQAAVFGDAMAKMFAQGDWSMFLDDLPYVCDPREGLGLYSTASVLYQQGRSVGLTLMAGTQRPRNVPLSALNQAVHLWIMRTADNDDLKRVAELGVFSRDELMDTIPHLPQYHALYLNVRTGRLAHVVAPPPPSPRRR